ncbi:hypothetical protein [Geodermatophilus sp. DSM 44513]|uniref:hypothetical protein n=1 Tax=Geodermatophilus sp. DSM 44513 TaxID=1528104 RepID=UPI0012854D00|nr:hypothetical protein [Geodermatophilus sp. DSM 44513]WNV77104.1 hypothetical protein RTG05_07480 [Geodermatophilus sp. DSM 44513]
MYGNTIVQFGGTMPHPTDVDTHPTPGSATRRAAGRRDVRLVERVSSADRDDLAALFEGRNASDSPAADILRRHARRWLSRTR